MTVFLGFGTKHTCKIKSPGFQQHAAVLTLNHNCQRDEALWLYNSGQKVVLYQLKYALVLVKKKKKQKEGKINHWIISEGWDYLTCAHPFPLQQNVGGDLFGNDYPNQGTSPKIMRKDNRKKQRTQGIMLWNEDVPREPAISVWTWHPADTWDKTPADFPGRGTTPQQSNHHISL